MKAKAACPLIFNNAEIMSEEFKKSIFESISRKKIFIECLIVNLHMFDRYAFQLIGNQKRSIFMDYLCFEVSKKLDLYVNNPTQVERFMKDFFEMYKKDNQNTAAVI